MALMFHQSKMSLQTTGFRRHHQIQWINIKTYTNKVSPRRDVTLLARHMLHRGELRCAAVESYRRRQTTSTTDASTQNSTGPPTLRVGGRVIIVTNHHLTGYLAPFCHQNHLGLHVKETILRHDAHSWPASCSLLRTRHRAPRSGRRRPDLVHRRSPSPRDSSRRAVLCSANTAQMPKVKEVTWQWPRPFKKQFVVRGLGLAMINMHTEFEVSSLSRFRDILGGLKV